MPTKTKILRGGRPADQVAEAMKKRTDLKKKKLFSKK